MARRRRKKSSYAWGAEKENELRRIFDEVGITANCRSSRSGGLVDVWGARRYLYLVQVKRTDNSYSLRWVANLIRGIREAVTLPDTLIFVAVYCSLTKGKGKGSKWLFYTDKLPHVRLAD